MNATILLTLVAPVVFQAQSLTTYRLSNGRSIRARTLEVNYEENKAHMQGIVDGEQREGWVDIDVFSPRSGIRILKAGMDQNTPLTYLRTAKYAADKSELDEARKLVNEAQALPAYNSLPADIRTKVAERVSEILEKEFHDATFAGNFNKAERSLKELEEKYPDTKSGGNVPKLKEILESKKQAEAAHKAEVAALEQHEKAQRAIDKRIRPIERNIEAGNAMNQKALNEGSKFSRAKKSFGVAIQYFERAMRSSDHLIKKYGNDKEATGKVVQLRQQASDGKKQSLLSAASLASTQSDFRGAMGYVNKVLAYLPDDADAKAQRQAIQNQAAMSGGFGRW